MSPLHRVLVCLLVLCAASLGIFASAGDNYPLDSFDPDPELIYYVRTTNGDVLSGLSTQVKEDGKGHYIELTTINGRIQIYEVNIAWIGLYADSYRADSRGLIIPNAEPIGNDAYIGVTEAVMPTIGFGYTPYLNVVAGRTIIPGIGAENQFSLVNIKSTIYEAENGLVEGGKQFYAVGFNASWVNDVNFIGHIYGAATFTGKRTRLTTLLHWKAVGKEVYTISSGTLASRFQFPYINGTLGVALMMDVRFPELHDVHLLGELWGADISRPAQSGLFVGLRQTNNQLTYDFGLGLLPRGVLVPIVNFAWTPW
ncbi:MAG: hypothetical protein FJ211_07265 [Ignavibacteria bacterium]|nr:hypothetical protein [Ignavibacteria bacterium]